MTVNPENPLHAFAEWTSNIDTTWSDLALDRARDAIIDLVAVMIPGAQEEVTQKVYSLAKSWGVGDCHAVGFEGGLSAPMAALVNGTAAHALDFDDNFDPAKAHATAVLGPALLALAEERGYRGNKLLDAYIVGLQMIGRVGQGVNPYHRNRGWHATATVGAVGSAAGCARLLGLGFDQTKNAISLATSMAGGFMSQFGTMTKPLHAGLAAAGAVKAALFAEAGITAGDNTLHAENGMGTLMVGQDVEDLRAFMADKDEHGQKVAFVTDNIGQPLHIEKYGLKVKRFPNCGSVHRALDGLLQLRENHDLIPEDVTDIFVRAPASHLRNLMYNNPVNSMQAKFSLEYGMAVGLLYGNATLADYEEEAVSRPEVTALLGLTRKEYVEKLESDFPTEVHVTLRNGSTVSAAIEMPVGSSAAPLTPDQLWEKFDGCAKERLTAVQYDGVREALEGLQQNADVRGLISYLVPPTTKRK